MCKSGKNACAIIYKLSHLIGIRSVGIVDKELHKLSKSRQFLLCAGIHACIVGVRVGDNCPERHSILHSHSLNLFHCRLADSSRRIIYHSAQCLIIIRVNNKTEISNHILNLFTLIERESSIDSIGDISFAQSLFKNTALCVGAIKNGKFIIRIMMHHL